MYNLSVSEMNTTDQVSLNRESGWLELDEERFRHNFSRRGFMIEHRLAQHPLFELPRLIELSRHLPEQDVSYHSGDVPLTTVLHQGPRNGLSVEETIRRIEECRSWMVLKHVEQDPEYAALLNQCLDQVRALTEPLDPGMYRREGFIFISSPGSTTPFHLDPEYNFLLQIRGEKEVSLWEPDDHSVIPATAMESFLAGENPHFTYQNEFQKRATVFKLTPGCGLHFPAAAPHWVQNGPEVSISFSITFLTQKYQRQTLVSALNESLRRRGLKPVPLGQSKLYDTLGYHGFRAWLSARKLLKRQAETPRTDYR
jgi:hypothetical protein